MNERTMSKWSAHTRTWLYKLGKAGWLGAVLPRWEQGGQCQAIEDVEKFHMGLTFIKPFIALEPVFTIGRKPILIQRNKNKKNTISPFLFLF